MYDHARIRHHLWLVSVALDSLRTFHVQQFLLDVLKCCLLLVELGQQLVRLYLIATVTKL